MLVKIDGYKIGSQSKVDVTDVEASFDAKGVATSIMNTGTNTIHLSNITGVSVDNYELRAGQSLIVSNKVYVICASTQTSTLKTMQLI